MRIRLRPSPSRAAPRAGGVASAQFASQATCVASSTGTNSIAITVPNVSTLADIKGVPIPVLMTNSITAAPVTLAVNGLTATSVEKLTTSGLAALVGGAQPEIVAGQIFDGADRRLELVTPNSSSPGRAGAERLRGLGQPADQLLGGRECCSRAP